MHRSLQVVLNGKDDTQGRSQLPQHRHIMVFLIPLASEKLHAGWADAIPTSLVINSWGQTVYLIVPSKHLLSPSFLLAQDSVWY